MSVEVKVQRAKVDKTKKGNDKTGLYDGKDWFNIMGAHPELQGKTVSLKPGDFKGWYELEFVVDEKAAATENGDSTSSGKLEWSVYMTLVQAAHDLAKDLEPDIPGEGGMLIDRSEARRAIVNTILIAHSNGAFEFPETPF